ncbi:MAG: ATP synthase gamma chain [Holosporales bacterium]
MGSLKQLRTRIRSVSSTQKITAAMKMVAAAKLRRAEENAKGAYPFKDEVLKILKIVSAYGEIEKLSKVATGSDAPPLFILFASDRGLCGGFNATMFKTFSKTVLPYLESEKPFYCLGFGKRAVHFLNKNYPHHLLQDGGPFQSLNDSSIVSIVKMFRDLLDCSKVGSIHIVYTFYKNVINLIPTVQTLIPLTINLNTTSGGEKDIYVFEPDANHMIDDLIEIYMQSELFGCHLQSESCEHAARMTAMDNSTRNAKEMVSHLKLTYNRTRQALITKELIEIISGAKAATL